MDLIRQDFFFGPRRVFFLQITRFILLGRRIFHLVSNAMHHIFRIRLAHHTGHRTHRTLGYRETHHSREGGTPGSNRGPLEPVGTVPAHRGGLGTDHFYATMWSQVSPFHWYQFYSNQVYQAKKIFFNPSLK